MKFILPLSLIVLFAIIFQISFTSAATVTASFDVKDSNGAALPDALVIVQGVGATNSDFSESKLTDSTGKTSFNLNQNELFIYIVYKLGYEEKSGSFLANTNKNFSVAAAKLPDDRWFFYLFNNGELEFRFKSLDADTNYVPGEYMKKTLEVRNVNDREIQLVDGKGFFQVIDAETNKSLRAWGDFDLSAENDFKNIVLKKDGMIQITFSENEVEVCASNLRLSYGGLNIELSGGETLCVDDAQETTKIPSWILEEDYKFKVERFYKIDGQEKSFSFTSQKFFIDSSEWKPEIVSTPTTSLNQGQQWTYQAQIKSFDASFSPIINLLNYTLVKSPSGMTVNQSGLVSWASPQAGNHEVVLRAYHEYFEGDSAKTTFFDQNFTLNVAGTPTNSVPQITSTAITSANEGSVYTYDVQATDADGDTLTYTLAQKPSWLSINSATGLITGTAPEVAADQDFNVVVSVSDGKDEATQQYTLTVKNVILPPPANSLPVITSTPDVTTINESAGFAYQVVATDSDGDSLTYVLTEGPTWLSISSSGFLSGIAPEVTQNTQFTVSIRVSDGRGGADTQTFTLSVNNLVIAPENTVPTISSTPTTSVNENAVYSYQVIAADADGDSLVYSLTQGPAWLSINSATGLITGTAPEVAGNTTFQINVRISDGKSTTNQFYSLRVNNIISLPPPENKAPKIESSPLTEVREGMTYSYKIVSTDADGDELKYGISGPEWLAVDNLGLVQGVAPEVSSKTAFYIILSVSDGKSTTTQNYVLTVNDTVNTVRVSRKSHDTTVLPDQTTYFYETVYLKQRNQQAPFVESINAITSPSVSQGSSISSQGFSSLLTNPAVFLFIVLNLNMAVLISLIKFYK